MELQRVGHNLATKQKQNVPKMYWAFAFWGLGMQSLYLHRPPSQVEKAGVCCEEYTSGKLDGLT